MRSILLISFSLIGFLSFSQATTISVSSGHSFNIIPDYDSSSPYVSGTMYLDLSFNQARIDQDKETVFLRYNAYRDEMESKQADQIYYLIKDENTKVNFFNIKKTYIHIKYIDVDGQEKRRFLLELVDGKKSLYKSEKITLIPAKETTTGYETSKPAEYKKSNDIYYIRIGERETATVFPKNKKQLLKLFPSENTQISDFLKNNKISFSKEDDIIKLTKFLNTL